MKPPPQISLETHAHLLSGSQPQTELPGDGATIHWHDVSWLGFLKCCLQKDKLIHTTQARLHITMTCHGTCKHPTHFNLLCTHTPGSAGTILLHQDVQSINVAALATQKFLRWQCAPHEWFCRTSTIVFTNRCSLTQMKSNCSTPYLAPGPHMKHTLCIIYCTSLLPT
jgi:hypothetical protein